MSQTPTTPTRNQLSNHEARTEDLLERWQYRIFRWVLFILFLGTIVKLLDHEFHLREFIRSLWK